MRSISKLVATPVVNHVLPSVSLAQMATKQRQRDFLEITSSVKAMKTENQTDHSHSGRSVNPLDHDLLCLNVCNLLARGGDPEIDQSLHM
eukprot:CAMPEP_0172569388 /NCGR_PEP_ID=MMETSP1067-20121228/123272_1 /TAXON_ID=265564 ORGANISM="Thalassiosira punctigera, Strain Tpunct2005C2" /NCGR_SAMPLE_ID=MMETSP1067 /ASSEMBLY_ACC=CAM_ASM_000444 /LENGTH=89 /DNA_ID=CAMNT_0013361193 /DNA_START=1 /DNA_END=267 /DNA_ORIENTATION=+